MICLACAAFLQLVAWLKAHRMNLGWPHNPTIQTFTSVTRSPIDDGTQNESGVASQSNNPKKCFSSLLRGLPPSKNSAHGDEGGKDGGRQHEFLDCRLRYGNPARPSPEPWVTTRGDSLWALAVWGAGHLDWGLASGLCVGLLSASLSLEIASFAESW